VWVLWNSDQSEPIYEVISSSGNINYIPTIGWSPAGMTVSLPPSPTPTPTSTPTPTTTPTVTQTRTPTIVCLTNPSIINVVYSNGNKYVFNNSSSYNSNIVYGLGIGTYILQNISIDHPMALLNDGVTSSITYRGDIDKKSTKLVHGVSYDFYWGNITVQVNSNFNTISVYCYYHGYMGGENLLKYSAACLIQPTPTPTSTPTPTPTPTTTPTTTPTVTRTPAPAGIPLTAPTIYISGLSFQNKAPFSNGYLYNPYTLITSGLWGDATNYVGYVEYVAYNMRWELYAYTDYDGSSPALVATNSAPATSLPTTRWVNTNANLIVSGTTVISTTP